MKTFKEYLKKEDPLPQIPVNFNQINYGIRSKISVPNDDVGLLNKKKIKNPFEKKVEEQFSEVETSNDSIIQAANNIDLNLLPNLVKLLSRNKDNELANFFDVPNEKISSWISRIKNSLEEFENNKINNKNKIITTGT